MIKNLLTKKPFVRVAPNYSLWSYESGDINSTFYDDRVNGYMVLKQSDFIRELNISGHKINSPIYVNFDKLVGYLNLLSKQDKV